MRFQFKILFVSVAKLLRLGEVSLPPPVKKDEPGRRSVCSQVSMYVSILEFAGNGPKKGNGPRWRFRARHAAAILSLLKYKYGRSFLFSTGFFFRD